MIFASMPTDADTAFGFAYRYTNAIAPYNGLNWTDMPSVQSGYYGRIETRGYFDTAHGGTFSFYNSTGELIAIRGFNDVGWTTDWIFAQ